MYNNIYLVIGSITKSLGYSMSVSSSTFRLLPDNSDTSILEVFSSHQYSLSLIQSTATEPLILYKISINYD